MSSSILHEQKGFGATLSAATKERPFYKFGRYTLEMQPAFKSLEPVPYYLEHKV